MGTHFRIALLGPEERSQHDSLLDIERKILTAVDAIRHGGRTANIERQIQEGLASIRTHIRDLELLAEEQDTEEQMLAVEQCLRVHKVEYDRIKSSINIAKMQAQQAQDQLFMQQRRELLSGADLPSLQRKYQQQSDLVAGAQDITDSLRRSRQLMAQQLESSGGTLAVLDTSTAVLEQAKTELVGQKSLHKQSHKLLGTLHSQDRGDRLLLWLGLLLFLSAAGYVGWKRAPLVVKVPIRGSVRLAYHTISLPVRGVFHQLTKPRTRHPDHEYVQQHGSPHQLQQKQRQGAQHAQHIPSPQHAEHDMHRRAAREWQELLLAQHGEGAPEHLLTRQKDDAQHRHGQQQHEQQQQQQQQQQQLVEEEEEEEDRHDQQQEQHLQERMQWLLEQEHVSGEAGSEGSAASHQGSFDHTSGHFDTAGGQQAQQQPQDLPDMLLPPGWVDDADSSQISYMPQQEQDPADAAPPSPAVRYPSVVDAPSLQYAPTQLMTEADLPPEAVSDQRQPPASLQQGVEQDVQMPSDAPTQNRQQPAALQRPSAEQLEARSGVRGGKTARRPTRLPPPKPIPGHAGSMPDTASTADPVPQVASQPVTEPDSIQEISDHPASVVEDGVGALLQSAAESATSDRAARNDAAAEQLTAPRTLSISQDLDAAELTSGVSDGSNTGADAGQQVMDVAAVGLAAEVEVQDEEAGPSTVLIGLEDATMQHTQKAEAAIDSTDEHAALRMLASDDVTEARQDAADGDDEQLRQLQQRSLVRQTYKGAEQTAGAALDAPDVRRAPDQGFQGRWRHVVPEADDVHQVEDQQLGGGTLHASELRQAEQLQQPATAQTAPTPEASIGSNPDFSDDVARYATAAAADDTESLGAAPDAGLSQQMRAAAQPAAELDGADDDVHDYHMAREADQSRLRAMEVQTRNAAHPSSSAPAPTEEFLADSPTAGAASGLPAHATGSCSVADDGSQQCLSPGAPAAHSPAGNDGWSSDDDEQHIPLYATAKLSSKTADTTDALGAADEHVGSSYVATPASSTVAGDGIDADLEPAEAGADTAADLTLLCSLVGLHDVALAGVGGAVVEEAGHAVPSPAPLLPQPQAGLPEQEEANLQPQQETLGQPAEQQPQHAVLQSHQQQSIHQQQHEQQFMAGDGAAGQQLESAASRLEALHDLPTLQQQSGKTAGIPPQAATTAQEVADSSFGAGAENMAAHEGTSSSLDSWASQHSSGLHSGKAEDSRASHSHSQEYLQGSHDTSPDIVADEGSALLSRDAALGTAGSRSLSLDGDHPTSSSTGTDASDRTSSSSDHEDDSDTGSSLKASGSNTGSSRTDGLSDHSGSSSSSGDLRGGSGSSSSLPVDDATAGLLDSLHVPGGVDAGTEHGGTAPALDVVAGSFEGLVTNSDGDSGMTLSTASVPIPAAEGNAHAAAEGDAHAAGLLGEKGSGGTVAPHDVTATATPTSHRSSHDTAAGAAEDETSADSSSSTEAIADGRAAAAVAASTLNAVVNSDDYEGDDEGPQDMSDQQARSEENLLLGDQGGASGGQQAAGAAEDADGSRHGQASSSYTSSHSSDAPRQSQDAWQHQYEDPGVVLDDGGVGVRGGGLGGLEFDLGGQDVFFEDAFFNTDAGMPHGFDPLQFDASQFAFDWDDGVDVGPIDNTGYEDEEDDVGSQYEEEEHDLDGMGQTDGDDDETDEYA